jgi:hypothetical protein
VSKLLALLHMGQGIVEGLLGGAQRTGGDVDAPPSSACMANLNPSSSPSRKRAGMRTALKFTSRVGWLFQPIFSSALP